MQTKLEELKQMWADGDLRWALKLAASWPRLGEHKDRIQAGWAAQCSPDFYRQMEKDPEAMYHDGLFAVAERYNLPLYKCDGCRVLSRQNKGCIICGCTGISRGYTPKEATV